MKRERNDRKGNGKDMEKENRTWRKQLGGRMLIASVMAAMVLCMGCNGTEEATSDNPDNTADVVETVETPTPPAEEVTVQPEATQSDESETEEPSEPEETGSEEPTESEVTDGTVETDEWTSLYNDYKNQGVVNFTLALCEAGYDQICLVNGDNKSTDYFSVKDGNHYTIPKDWDVYLYVPYIPTEYSCDNEDIILYYNYSDTASDFFKLQINMIQLYSKDFEGDDVPVNISVTFEDGSTQEITVYLTRHAE